MKLIDPILTDTLSARLAVTKFPDEASHVQSSSFPQGIHELLTGQVPSAAF